VIDLLHVAYQQRRQDSLGHTVHEGFFVFNHLVQNKCMRKLPTIQLSLLTPYALALVALGFCLMQTRDWQDIGAIVFTLGLLPPAVLISRNKD